MWTRIPRPTGSTSQHRTRWAGHLSGVDADKHSYGGLNRYSYNDPYRHLHARNWPESDTYRDADLHSDAHRYADPHSDALRLLSTRTPTATPTPSSTPSTANPGDVVINEIMQNPKAVLQDTDGEWFEVYNATGHAH